MARLESNTPSIACIGVIGRENQPLHIALFPPYSPPTQPNDTASTDTAAQYLRFSYILHSSIDIFIQKSRDRTRVDQDFGLLHAVDERLSVWGWETPTGTRFIIVLDAIGRQNETDAAGTSALAGGGGIPIWAMRDGDLKSAFKSLHIAYIRLLQNPFYMPDEHSPKALNVGPKRNGMIQSKKFTDEVQRIGMAWRPGLSTV